MKTYLVAGGAGFIGSHLCEALLSEGAKVICIDNLITGEEDNISHLFDNPDFLFTNFNLIKGIPGISHQVDGIFHLASPASPNAKSPRSFIAYPVETLMVNSVGTKNLLDLAIEKKATFLYASSSEVYGDPHVSPQAENYFGNVNPNGPRSVYDEGKRFGEALVMAYFRKFNLDARIIRIFNTYGDRMQKDDGRVVSNFINQAIVGEPITVYGDGNQTRSFCYISDMVNGLVSAMEPGWRERL
jgi:nucleoside-diphosphate-sugar epimerase